MLFTPTEVTGERGQGELLSSDTIVSRPTAGSRSIPPRRALHRVPMHTGFKAIICPDFFMDVKLVILA